MNANASRWMREGLRLGLDLGFLQQDKKFAQEQLGKLGLPHPKLYCYNPEDYREAYHLFEKGRVYKGNLGENEPEDIQQERGNIQKESENIGFFCRLLPSDPDGERPYRLLVSSPEELEQFVKEFFKENVPGEPGRAFSELHLIEKGEVLYTGCIIAVDCNFGIPDRCAVELVSGDGPDLFHGKKTPLSLRIGSLPRPFPQWSRRPGLEESSIIQEAKYLIGGRHPFPGYYEFEVWKPRRIMFRNYQGPASAYARL